jgi:hypothetical protein
VARSTAPPASGTKPGVGKAGASRPFASRQGLLSGFDRGPGETSPMSRISTPFPAASRVALRVLERRILDALTFVVDLVDVDAVADQGLAGLVDVLYDEMQASNRSRFHRDQRQAGSQHDRASGARWSELNDSDRLGRSDIDVPGEPQSIDVKRLRRGLCPTPAPAQAQASCPCQLLDEGGLTAWLSPRRQIPLDLSALPLGAEALVAPSYRSVVFFSPSSIRFQFFS